jgi:hypothetical protein
MIVGKDTGDFGDYLAKGLRIMLCRNHGNIEGIGDFQGKDGGVSHSLIAVYFGQEFLLDVADKEKSLAPV